MGTRTVFKSRFVQKQIKLVNSSSKICTFWAQFWLFLALIYKQINPVASLVQRHPKKTKAERSKSEALLYGANEGGESSLTLSWEDYLCRQET